MSIRNNNIMLIGNLGKPAKITETKAGTVAKFSLAVYRSGRGDEAITDWLPVVCWHGLARGMDNVAKGTKLIVIGSVATRNYENKDGAKVYITEILAREIGMSIEVKEDRKEMEEEDFSVPF
jgi:single-strand DNA-binding protein